MAKRMVNQQRNLVNAQKWCNIAANAHQLSLRTELMSRTSISFTPPNDEWIKSQIESEEFNSKSEVVNDLIRKARKEQEEISYIRAKLIASEKSGFTDLTRNEILEKSKEELRKNGKI